MSFQVTSFVNGKRRQNCHIIANSTSDALTVDPGSQPQKIGGLIDGNAWRVHAIINTHGYYDPVGTVAGLMERYQAAFYLHRADEQLLKHANPYRMLFESRGGNPDSPITHDRSRPPSVFVGPFEVCWILAPGHTNESVCPLLRNFLFSGDSLMRDCVGRTDLPGGDGDKLVASERKPMELPRDVAVCGSHGPRTTLDAEFSSGTCVWRLLQ